MSIKKNQLFSAGDFANIFNINKQTLIYYDKMGVFSPYIKDENGYRYYSFEQYDILSMILTLKEIISLNDIKDYTVKRDSEFFIKLFESNILKLNNQIDTLIATRDMMSAKVKRVKKAHNISGGIGKEIIFTEYCDAEYLKLSAKIMDFANSRENLGALGSIMNYRMKNHLNFDRAIGGMVKREVFLAHNRNEYDYYYAAETGCTDKKVDHVKAEGNYLIYYHKGHYELAYTSYEKIIRHAYALGYQIGDYIYEESIVDEVVETNAENYIVKISVPIAQHSLETHVCTV